MQLPEAEVLVLNFRTVNYVLPKFWENMEKLEDSHTNIEECAEDIFVYVQNCNDLAELPALNNLSITNCSYPSALPREIGKLVNLEVLRLRSYVGLVELSDSISNLSKLTLLDITYCTTI
ncbi:hypothetical protein FEM48_Zijuj08G0111500 [Ziziphus jujuba var. spinosa]|uniref:Uncharacterized protein n=1 Tax=Ziziphus jujuba var. spinosa TaxID=714518 RepID=A0A978UYR4_ZIZJJ|nr:hypothetical protein FEM48_Zijuj08G0111500 [Ziziphus jujuba var. spinosa]